MIRCVLGIAIGISSFCGLSAVLQAQTVDRLSHDNSDRTSSAVQVAPSLVSLAKLDGPQGASGAQEENPTSPSDQNGLENIQDLSQEKGSDELANQKAEYSQPDSDEKSSAGSDLLAPMQNRQLTLKVHAVSISHDQIGTGLIPSSSRPQWSSEGGSINNAHQDGLYTHVYWQASMIQHNPLYFEDAMLERHGHARCCRGWEVSQSIVSGAKFFGTIPLLPYLRTLQPKHDCVYSLGHYRAGSPAPCLRSNLPYDRRAAIVESASAAAFFWAAPL